MFPWQRETKCRQEKPTGGLRQSEVFFPLAVVAHHAVSPGICPDLIQNRPDHVFDRAIVIFDKVWRTSTMFASPFWFLRNIALPITNLKTTWTSDRTRRQPATAISGHQYDYDFGFLWIARSAILVVLHTQNIAGGKISGLEREAFTRQNFPDSKVFGFKVPTLDSGFKISGGWPNRHVFISDSSSCV